MEEVQKRVEGVKYHYVVKSLNGIVKTDVCFGPYDTRN